MCMFLALQNQYCNKLAHLARNVHVCAIFFYLGTANDAPFYMYKSKVS